MKTNWNKGDIAICVNVDSLYGDSDAENPPLRKNLEYVVQAIDFCPCGQVSLDVGIAASSTDDEHYCRCGRATINEPIWWCAAERFVKKDTRSMEEQLADALGKENYELAAELQSKSKKA